MHKGIIGKWFALVLMLLVGSFSFAKSYKITGENIDASKSKVYLYEAFGEELFVIDSASVTKGDFTFKIADDMAKGVYALGYDLKSVVPVVLPVEDITVVGIDGGKLTLKDAPNCKEVQKYFNHLSEYDNSLRKIEGEYGKIVPLQKSNPEEFNKRFGRIRMKLDSLNKARVLFFRAFFNSSPSDFAKGIAEIFLSDSTTNKSNFLTREDIANDVLTRGVILEKKINMHFMNFVNLSSKNLKSEFEYVLSISPEGSRGRQVVYSSLIKISNAFDKAYSKQLYKEMSNEYPNSKYVPRCKRLLPPSPPSIGEEAPEIALPNAEGEIMKLSSLRGKVVLIDFWASWCGPCRREMPNVVAAYNAYKDKGFTVYSISLDGDKGRWQNAIKQDGMVWPYHVSELKKWNSTAARSYFVRGIPATFLIDENGVIVGTNLRGPALHRKLAELLSAK